MDRPIAQSQRRRNALFKWLRILGILLVVIAAIWGFRSLLKTRVETDDFRFAEVEIGDLENTISASGTIIPAFEEQINAPVSTEIKSVLVPSGTAVQPGEVLMQLDEEFVRLEYESLKDRLALQENKIVQLRLQYNKDVRELEYNDQIKALELSSKEALLEDVRRLRDIGSATQEEVEKAELDLQIVKLEKKKLENELEFRREAVSSNQREFELEVEIQQKKIKELTRKLDETKVLAPRAGVVTWINESIGKKAQEGEALVRLANLESYRIEASCSDRYTNLVKVGMPVKVRINKTYLPGQISSVLPAVENNTVEFIVLLEDQKHPDLRPNMRVEVYIISDRKENVLRVHNGPAFTGARQQALFVVRGDQAIREDVQIGLTNRDYVEIIAGRLQQGDQIIISDMESYDHLETIELKK